MKDMNHEDTVTLELPTYAVMYLRRHLTARADIEGDESQAARVLPLVDRTTSVSREDLDYLKRQLESCADKEGDEVGPAIRILSELSEV